MLRRLPLRLLPFVPLALLVASCHEPIRADPIAQVRITAPTTQVTVGSDLQLGLEVFAADGALLLGRVVAWTSSDTTVATVDPMGLVRGLAAGGTVIRAEAEGVSDEVAISVVEPSTSS